MYRSLSVELRKMMGEKLYRQVVAYLEEREALQQPVVVHPAQKVSLKATRRRLEAAADRSMRDYRYRPV